MNSKGFLCLIFPQGNRTLIPYVSLRIGPPASSDLYRRDATVSVIMAKTPTVTFLRLFHDAISEVERKLTDLFSSSFQCIWSTFTMWSRRWEMPGSTQSSSTPVSLLPDWRTWFPPCSTSSANAFPPHTSSTRKRAPSSSSNSSWPPLTGNFFTWRWAFI